MVDWDIYAATRLGCLQIACSLSDQPSNQLGSGGLRNRVWCQGPICSSVVWEGVKAQGANLCPGKQGGIARERAVIRAQGGVPSLPCHPFYRVGHGVVPSPSRPSLNLRPATLKPKKTQGRRVRHLHMEVRRLSMADEQASSLWRWLVNALDDAKQ